MDEDVNVNVVVHCMCGVSRSPTIDIAYLMAIQDMSLSDSLSHVRAKREISYPNRGIYESASRLRFSNTYVNPPEPYAYIGEKVKTYDSSGHITCSVLQQLPTK
jgi:protein-tyrosine phosphatase